MYVDKKLLAVSIVAGAALLAGCSSDSDDDDRSLTSNGGIEDGPVTSNNPGVPNITALALILTNLLSQ